MGPSARGGIQKQSARTSSACLESALIRSRRHELVGASLIVRIGDGCAGRDGHESFSLPPRDAVPGVREKGMLAHTRFLAAAHGGTLATTRTHTRHLARGKLTCRASAKHMLLYANTHVHLIRPATQPRTNPRARARVRSHVCTHGHSHTHTRTHAAWNA